jgi:triosephosphate isomerase
MARKKFVAGNWKMNTTCDEAVALAKQLVASVGDVQNVDVAVCPPYVNCVPVQEVIKDSWIELGAQDLYWESKGAFTGKVSAPMLTAIGATYVIIGHSEQRQYFGETDDTVNKKLNAALEADLRPIVCVGETLQERNDNRMEEVVSTQIQGGFAGIDAARMRTCTIAYEPVWAIGTGETATPQQAQDMHAFIRKMITEMYDEEIAQGMRIQYGGSVKPGNAAELFAKEDIDGGLIGGAALKADAFSDIIAAA